MNGNTSPLIITDSVPPATVLVADIAWSRLDEFYFLGRQPRLSPTRDRLEGFTQGLQQAGVALQPEQIIYGNCHPSLGYEMFAALYAHLERPPKVLLTVAYGLLGGVLRYMSQYSLLDSKTHLTSFDDHYLYDSLPIRIDTIQQDNHQLALHCFELISQLIEDETPSPLQRYLPASLQKCYR